MFISCLFCVFFFGTALAFPWENAYNGPHRVVMMSGYYGTPVQGRSHQYVPQGSISAFVNKDTVATQTYAGSPLDLPGGELPLEQESGADSYPDKTDVQEFSSHEAADETPQPIPHVAIEDADSSSANEGSTDVGTLATKAPKRVARKKKNPKPVVPQEDEEEDEEPQKSYVPSNNVYFPITITGSGGLRNRARNGAEQPEDEFYAPGSATAIANSYSTGRGGIATSHATSFGDPYLASMLYRSGFFNNNKAKKGHTDV